MNYFVLSEQDVEWIKTVALPAMKQAMSEIDSINVQQREWEWMLE